MKLLMFELKKLFRSAGFVYLCVGILILNLLSCIFTPSFVESDGYIENYESSIAYVIRVAERNLLEYEATVGDENYIVRYQRDVIDRYTNLLDNGVSPEEVRGWNEFFENKEWEKKPETEREDEQKTEEVLLEKAEENENQ